MKKCTFCAEEIQEEAKKYKHCGEFLMEKEKKEIRSGIGDFSGCKELKGKDGPATIRCPKCGFHGISRKIEGNYNKYLFWLFFVGFPVVGGILYRYLSIKDYYICPNCGNDYLEVLSQQHSKKEKKKSDSNTIRIIILLGFLCLMLIVLLGGK